MRKSSNFDLSSKTTMRSIVLMLALVSRVSAFSVPRGNALRHTVRAASDNAFDGYEFKKVRRLKNARKVDLLRMTRESLLQQLFNRLV